MNLQRTAGSRLPHGDVSRSRVQIEHGAAAAHLAANLAAIVGGAFLRNRRVNRNAAGAGARVNIETGLRSHPEVHAARSSLDSPRSRRLAFNAHITAAGANCQAAFDTAEFYVA